MQSKLTILILLFAISLLYSCESDLEYGRDFFKSKREWLAFKDATGNTYTYTVTGSSPVGGIAWETELTISGGNIIKRAFQFTWTAGLPEDFPEEELAWIETGSELDTHEFTPAADLLTLDDVYEKATQEWLQKRSDTKTYFETENDGMISLCGYVPIGCADDCFRGIRIASISAMELE